MIKKFLPLTVSETHNNDPHDVETYKAREYEKPKPTINVNPCCFTSGKPLCPRKTVKVKRVTIEEEIYKFYEKRLNAPFEDFPCKKRCGQLDKYTNCVATQRTPSQLKLHAWARENYLLTQQKLKTVKHDASPELAEKAKSLVKLESPVTSGPGDTKPKLASPACSFDAVYIPSRRMLEMKSPRSGVFLNEREIHEPTDIPYDTYNPRLLQEEIEKQKWRKFHLYPNDKGHYTWYEGSTVCDNECCCLYFQGQDNKPSHTLSECINFEPKLFSIPDDSGVTFKAAVLFGNGSLQPRSYQRDNRCPKEVACLFTAFAQFFTLHPDLWTPTDLDDIVRLGDELHEKGVKFDYKNPDGDFDIIPEIESKATAVELIPHFAGKLCELPNVLKTLHLFFLKYQSAVFVMEDTYLLIIKRCSKSFYIFDPNGRNADCDRDHVNGKCVLIQTAPIEHVVHLIMHLNSLSCEEDYRLYEIRLKTFGVIPNPMTFSQVKKSKLYAVVHQHFALIPGTVGIPPPEDVEDQNSSLMTCFIALIYHQIDPPPHWTKQIIESIIKYGAQRYIDFIRRKEISTLRIWDLPDAFVFGTYRATIVKYPFLQNGQVNDCRSYRNCALIESVKQFFREHNLGLLQIDSSTIAMWRDFRFYYVFDPFQRGSSGQVINPDGGSGVGCLQLHITLDSLLRVLYKNGLRMRSKTGGHFFLHAIKIESVQVLVGNSHLMDTTFEALHVKYPFPCEDLLKKYTFSCSNLADQQASGDVIPLDCLSNISVTPCERACSESEFLENEKKDKGRQRKLDNVIRMYSIQSIPETERTAPYDTIDIVDGVLADFICRLMMIIKRKTEKRVRTSVEASKILLKSDKGHLKELKKKLKHGEDYDNICVPFRTKPDDKRKAMTLEEELAIPSNFIPVPDGSEALFGSRSIEPSENDFHTGVLSAILALVLSRRYKISSWNSILLDFTTDSCTTLLEELSPSRHIISFLLKRKLPKIQLGKETFQPQVRSTASGKMSGFATTLKQLLTKTDMALVTFTTFACAVIRRYNFYYLYLGYPCDLVGYRTSAAGHSCLLRFSDFDNMLRRIDFARFKDAEYESFVIVNFHVKDVTSAPQRFVTRTPSDEQELYDKEMLEKNKEKKKLFEKLMFIDRELDKEEQRLKVFAKYKTQNLKKKGIKHATYEEEDKEEMDEEDVEDEEATAFKHTPGNELSRLGGDQFNVTHDNREIGYMLRDNDCHFKIQGTAFLDDRGVVSNESVKTCYFAAIYAILNAILCPLSKWDFRRMDSIIENAKDLALRVKRKNNVRERTVKNVLVGNYMFQVLVCAYEQYVPPTATIADYIDIICRSKKYFMIQIPNGTFAVYKDAYFHLYDPYPTLEALSTEEHNEPVYCPPKFKRHPDRNTASWVLFSTCDDMLNYIDERSTERNWRDMYKLHVMSILSFKKASKEELMAYSLTMYIQDTLTDLKEDISCLKPEHVKWLEIYPNIVCWSRLKRYNLANDLRGQRSSMDKWFDVEIPNQLYSLWGSIHPMAAVFSKARGQQFLAVNVMACCLANAFRVTEWNRQVIDSIVIHGNNYFEESTATITTKDYELSLENLNTDYELDYLSFNIHIESVVYGYLYNTRKNEFNLGSALGYFFSYHRYGILHAMKKSLAIGRANVGYFMFDCQSKGFPLFPKDEGSAYVLRSTNLQTLLYCIIMTLNVPFYNIEFVIHKVDVNQQKLDDVGE